MTHLARGSLRLNNVRFLVLDETDRMLDMGFGVQIDKIIAHVPKETSDDDVSRRPCHAGMIVKMSAKYLVNPQRISVGSVTQAAPNIRQEVISVIETEKYQTLLAQLKGQNCTTIIFVKTKYGTEKLADKLSRLNITAQAIHRRSEAEPPRSCAAGLSRQALSGSGGNRSRRARPRCAAYRIGGEL